MPLNSGQAAEQSFLAIVIAIITLPEPQKQVSRISSQDWPHKESNHQARQHRHSYALTQR